MKWKKNGMFNDNEVVCFYSCMFSDAQYKQDVRGDSLISLSKYWLEGVNTHDILTFVLSYTDARGAETYTYCHCDSVCLHADKHGVCVLLNFL